MNHVEKNSLWEKKKIEKQNIPEKIEIKVE
jgi:hypothetical protein